MISHHASGKKDKIISDFEPPTAFKTNNKRPPPKRTRSWASRDLSSFGGLNATIDSAAIGRRANTATLVPAKAVLGARKTTNIWPKKPATSTLLIDGPCEGVTSCSLG